MAQCTVAPDALENTMTSPGFTVPAANAAL